MNWLRTILLFLFSNLIFGQVTNIKSEILSAVCDENVDAYRVISRITTDTISNNQRLINFSTIANCCANFDIASTLNENRITINIIENGSECDCICGYDFAVKFHDPLNRSTKFYIGNIELKKNLPKLKLYNKRYFVFEKDTTGFDDENGLRQGHIVLKRKNKDELKKIYYSNGKFIKLQITDKNGKVSITETDENKIFNY